MTNLQPDIWKRTTLPKSNNTVVVVDSVNAVPDFDFPIITKSIWSIVCLKGEININVDFNNLTLTQSTLMVMAPGHTVSSYSASDDFEGFAINSTVGTIESSLPLLSRILICIKAFHQNPIIKIDNKDIQNQILFRELLRNKLSEPSTPYNKLIINNLCTAITIETLSLYINRLHNASHSPIKRNRAEDLFFKFIVLVEDKFKTQRLLGDYAHDLGITTKHLSTLVKDISGRTAGSWIDSYVILEAKKMLLSSEMTIQEISEQLNFANQSFFGKFFKHNTGKSPSQFRKEHSL